MEGFMKYATGLCVSLLLVVGLTAAAWAGNAQGITGSAHDFSAQDWYPGLASQREICQPCHAPHDKGRTTYQAGLLWNHELSSATYVMYNNTFSPTLNNTVDSAPTGSSKLCLSCHDGTVALDSFDGHAGDPALLIGEAYGNLKRIPRAMSGSDLDMRGTHPISIAYSGGDTGLNPTTTVWQGGGTIADTLEDGKVQCASCHDVHNSSESIPGTLLLRAGQTDGQGGGSRLCLTCHNK